MAKDKWIAFAKKIDGISDWTGRLFAWLVIPLTILICYEVFTRYVLGAPTIWTFELSNFYSGPLHAGGGLRASAQVHVCIDIFVMRGSKKTAVTLDLISYFVLFFPFIFVILYHGIAYAIDSWATWETSWSTWGPPMYPAKTVIPVTAFLLLIQGISDVIKKVIYLKTGEEI